jgi:hypothetical protein
MTGTRLLRDRLSVQTDSRGWHVPGYASLFSFFSGPAISI